MTRSTYCQSMSEIMYQFSIGVITEKQKDEAIEKLNTGITENVEQTELFK